MSISIVTPRAAAAQLASPKAREFGPHDGAFTPKEPLMRSHLLVPADDTKRLEQAIASHAHCLWLDLEAVAPASKPRARERVLSFLQSTREKSARLPKLFVRVNGFESGEIDADLDIVLKGAPDGIVLPKSGGGVDVQHLGAKLALREAEYDLHDGGTQIIAIAAQIPAAMFKMGTYASASRRLAGLSWAPDDLAAAIGAESTRGPDGGLTPPYELARSLTLMGAKAAGVAAIDCAATEPRDDAGFEAECEAARRDGFAGKLAIGVDQVALINAIFA
jgi:citrate lyase subunit beta / citryl-CoA lyase